MKEGRRLHIYTYTYKVPLRDVPRGVAQERIDITIQNSILYPTHAYDIIVRRYELSNYLYITVRAGTHILFFRTASDDLRTFGDKNTWR